MATSKSFEIFVRECTHKINNYLEKNGWEQPEQVLNGPIVTYLLTKRQRADIKKICITRGIDYESGIHHIKGITLTVRDFRKALMSRMDHDSLSVEDVGELLAKAYSPKSLMKYNEHQSKTDQTFILNSQELLTFSTKDGFFAAAVLSLADDKIKPVTAYHMKADKAKRISNQRI